MSHSEKFLIAFGKVIRLHRMECILGEAELAQKLGKTVDFV
jgi:hypothetical protein